MREETTMRSAAAFYLSAWFSHDWTEDIWDMKVHSVSTVPFDKMEKEGELQVGKIDFSSLLLNVQNL